MEWMLVIIAAIAGGLFYSLRGGMIDRFIGGVGTQGARLCWAIPAGLYVAFTAGVPTAAPATIVAFWAGLLIPHAWCQGRTDEPWFMSSICFGRAFLAACATAAGPWSTLASPAVLGMLVLGGVLAGPAYWLGWRCPSPVPAWREPRSTEMGEFFTGAAVGASVCIGGMM